MTSGLPLGRCRGPWIAGALLLLATACNDGPAAPTPPVVMPVGVPVLAGSWAGTYAVGSCPGYPSCGNPTGVPPSGPQPLVLTFEQSGGALAGQINLSGWISRVADVTGTIAEGGSMTLGGAASWPRDGFCQPAGGWRLLSWNGRLDPASDTIIGDFSFVTQKHLSSCYYTDALQVNAVDLRLTRHKRDWASLAGHWQGTALVQRCTPTGWKTCQAPATKTFDLGLDQSGAAVTGALGFPSLPVTGTVTPDGQGLALEGSKGTVVSGAVEVTRLTRWSATLDAAGLLQGSYSYVDEVYWNTGPNIGTVWSIAYDVALQSVVRVPW